MGSLTHGNSANFEQAEIILYKNEENSTISKMEIVQNEGDRLVTRTVAIYNLDAIIAVGYRVNSIQTTMFLDDVELRAKDRVLMSMKDCDDALNGFLLYNRRKILQGQGSRSHRQAEGKARQEFEKFRKIQDETYKNDFEKLVEEIQREKKDQ